MFLGDQNDESKNKRGTFYHTYPYLLYADLFAFVEDKLRIRWDKGIPFLCAVTLRHSEDVQKQTLIIWLHTRPQGIGGQ